MNGSDREGKRPWALILGASRGTGAAIARAVAATPGLDVFGVHRGRHPEYAMLLRKDVTALGRRLHLRQGEAGSPESAVAGADELLSIAGPRSIKLFVHSIANASVGHLVSGNTAQLRPAQFQKTLESMANSFVYWTQELLSRDLLTDGALILGLSNPMPEFIARETGLIAAAKAALEIYVRHLARELGPRGHRVNLLKFGAVKTEAMTRTLQHRLPALERALLDAIPAQRLCTLEEVGRFVGILAGDDAAWFNGATIDFTGGEAQGLFDALIRAHQQRPTESTHDTRPTRSSQHPVGGSTGEHACEL